MPVPPVDRMLTSSVSDTRSATRSASCSAPMISRRPALLYVTVGTGSASGRRAAASSAAILGVASLASRPQPPVSRMLTNLMGRTSSGTAPSVCSESSVKRRLSWVQATTRSSLLRAARWNAGASRRHRVVCRVRSSSRASPRTLGFRGMVWLQLQISVVIVGVRCLGSGGVVVVVW